MDHTYLQCFDILIDHAYFADGTSNGILVTPTAQAEHIMKNSALKIRSGTNTFSLYGSPASPNASIQQWMEGIPPIFLQLITTDAYFFNYTELPFQTCGDRIWYLSNFNNDGSTNKLSSGRTLSLKPTSFYVSIPQKPDVEIKILDEAGNVVIGQIHDGTKSPKYHVNLAGWPMDTYTLVINGTVSESFVVTNQELDDRCFGIVKISFTTILQDLSSGKITYTIPLKSRSVFLEYSVIVAKHRQIDITKMTIVDANNQFNGPSIKEIGNNDQVQVFTSTSAVALSDNQVDKRYLKISYNTQFSERQSEWEKPLPLPNIKNVRMKTEDGNSQYCCETFVNV